MAGIARGVDAVDVERREDSGGPFFRLLGPRLGLSRQSVMALVLTSPVRWRSFWTGVLLIPWVAPTVVSALNFLWIFDGSLGVLNYLLVRVFRILPQGVGWLSEPGTAMASVVAVNIWRGFPFFGISFLAGMKAIPAELYEAAAIDRAIAVRVERGVLRGARPRLELAAAFRWAARMNWHEAVGNHFSLALGEVLGRSRAGEERRSTGLLVV